MAETLNITNYSGLRKQDLIFRIEQSLLDSDTVLRGEGVLEILPEGYGFLQDLDDIGSEEHTSELQSRLYFVCCLPLEKKILLVASCLNCLEAGKKPPTVAFKVMCLLPIIFFF